MKKEKSPWRWPVRIVIIGAILYFSRSFWPLLFQGEPYTEIEATIPADMTLRVGASYRSFDCTEMTFSDFSQIPGGRGWSKEYTPDSQGRVTAKIYQVAIGPCNWHLTDFGIDTIYNKIPDRVLFSSNVSDKIKKDLINRFGNKDNASNRIAHAEFRLSHDLSWEDKVNNNSINLKTVVTPAIGMNTKTDNSVSYDFGYNQKKDFDNPSTVQRFKSSNREKEGMKIYYHVANGEHILLEGFYPAGRADTSKIIE